MDWLGDALCRISARVAPVGHYRDAQGRLRPITPLPGYRRIVDAAYSKIRQNGRGMPAINVRQLDTLSRVAAYASGEDQRVALRRQADMIVASAEEAVVEEQDRADVRARYQRVLQGLRMRRSSDVVPDAVQVTDVVTRPG